MSNEEKIILYTATIEKWGSRAQLEMLQEEATELALATRKVIRFYGDETMEDLAGEIADVEIMLEQVKLMFPTLNSKSKVIKSLKLTRLAKRIEEGRFED